MTGSYWRNIDNCLKDMKTTIDYSYFRVCKRNWACNTKKNRLDTLFNESLVFVDYKIVSFTNKNLEKINNLNLSMRFSNWSIYYHVLYRIFANPKKDLIDQIVNVTNSIPFNNVTTLHVRSGGALANHKERAYWVTEDELPKLVNAIGSILNRYSLGRLIYLTTDSNIVDSYLRQHLRNVDFLTLNMYRRDHTTGDSKDESFRAALFDLFVSAQGSSILYTPGSGYSTAIRFLSQSQQQYELPLSIRHTIEEK